MPQHVVVRNHTRGSILADRATIAANAWTRAKGLLGRRTLTAGEGLVIRPCNSIHCFFMAFPIDVVYVNRDGRVLRLVPGLQPNRIGPVVPAAHEVIELPVDTLKATRTQVGDQIAYELPPGAPS